MKYLELCKEEYEAIMEARENKLQSFASALKEKFKSGTVEIEGNKIVIVGTKGSLINKLQNILYPKNGEPDDNVDFVGIIKDFVKPCIEYAENKTGLSAKIVSTSAEDEAIEGKDDEYRVTGYRVELKVK